MERKRMLTYLLKLLIENEDITVCSRPVIGSKTNDIEIIDIDIKFNIPFSKTYFLEQLRENYLSFDLLDIYIERAFEILDDIMGDLNTTMIMIKIPIYLVQEEYFLIWINYINEICEEFKMDIKRLIIEIQEIDVLKIQIDKHNLIKSLSKIKSYGIKIALLRGSKLVDLVKSDYIEIIDIINCNYYRDKKELGYIKQNKRLIRGKNIINQLEQVKYDYLEIDEQSAE